MTEQEYNKWLNETASSQYAWKMDDVTYDNHKTILAYKGGTNGMFVRIEQDGTVLVGYYKDAVPHIGEATFLVEGRKKYANYDEAFKRCVEAGGMHFLRGILFNIQ